MAFQPIDRDTDFLLPPSVQEWLPEAHLARYVVEVVEQLDLTAIERALRRTRQRRLSSGNAAGAADLWLRHRDVLQPQDRAGDV